MTITQSAHRKLPGPGPGAHYAHYISCLGETVLQKLHINCIRQGKLFVFSLAAFICQVCVRTLPGQTWTQHSKPPENP